MQRRHFGPVAILCVLILGLHIFLSKQTISVSKPTADAPASRLHRADTRCDLQFIAYKPSELESDWLQHAEAYAVDICGAQRRNASLVHSWLQTAAGAFDDGRPLDQTLLAAFDDEAIWSHFEYRSCDGEVVRVPFEPLMGLLRHPLAHILCRNPTAEDRLLDAAHDPPAWNPKDRNHRFIENKGYLALLPLTPQQVAQRWPGRRLLIDLGTGRYSSGSLPWFVRWYGHRGVKFDEIWSWEARQLPPALFWSEVPPNVTAKLRFYNQPAVAGRADPRNPLNLLRSWWRPGDFVALKLDIDNNEVEQQLMGQMRGEVAHMIGELFWEPHHNAAPMAMFFGKQAMEWTDTLRQFAAWRHQGLRLHYWP